MPDAIPRGPKYAVLVLAEGYKHAPGDTALDSTWDELVMKVQLDRRS